MTDLRPCPNPECPESSPRVSLFSDHYWVQCYGCHMNGPATGASPEHATRLWNAFPRRDTEAQITHSEECWRWHLDCALYRIESLETEKEQVCGEAARLERENAEWINRIGCWQEKSR